MPSFVALLRGVNVGKAKRVPMAELRTLLTGLGYTGVATLLNSGNAVFGAASGSPETHGAAIAAAIRKRAPTPPCAVASCEWCDQAAGCQEIGSRVPMSQSSVVGKRVSTSVSQA